jgi:hypothetical protein
MAYGGINLIPVSGDKFYLQSYDDYPQYYARYWDVRDEPWNMDNPDRNYGWHMLQDWTYDSRSSNQFSYRSWSDCSYLEFRMRCAEQYYTADFGWDETSSYDNPYYVIPMVDPPSYCNISYLNDRISASTPSGSPTGFSLVTDKRVYSSRLGSYVNDSYNPISSNDGWRGTDTWSPYSHSILLLEPYDWVQFSCFYRRTADEADTSRTLSSKLYLPPTPDCWYTPSDSQINVDTVSITPQADSSYSKSIDYRAYDTSSGWNDWSGFSGSYNIKNMDIGDKVQFRARYIAGGSYMTPDHDSNWGWGYSNQYTRISYRPDNFTLFGSLYSGKTMTYNQSSRSAIIIPASTWNAFTTRINDFRRYKGYSNYSFTMAYAGNTFTATMYNEAVSAMITLGLTTTSDKVVAGSSKITAYRFTYLSDLLNSIS